MECFDKKIIPPNTEKKKCIRLLFSDKTYNGRKTNLNSKYKKKCIYLNLLALQKNSEPLYYIFI